MTKSRKLIVASSMSLYGEGPYRCAPCNSVSFPELRLESKLSAKKWEFECAVCGSQLETLPTPEDKPLNPDLGVRCG